MKRCEIAADLDLAEHVVVHERTSGEEIGALHYAVAHRLDVIEAAEHSVDGIHEKVKHKLHSHLVVRNGAKFSERLLAGGLVGDLALRQAYFLHYTFGQKIIDIVTLHVKELVLDRRASAVDY